MNKIVCHLFGHKWRKGYLYGYAWEICSRCKEPGKPMIGKPKKRVSK